MKKEKKNFVFVVVCALLVSVLAGCGPSQESKKEKGGEGTAYGRAALRATLTGCAVDAEGMIVSANSLLDTDYLLIYFSAHWCPPCRKFTPKLVNFYNSYGENRPFDLVFVSSDRSEKDMFAYMRETKMPWAALQFKGASASRLSKHYAGSGIPCLVLISPSGKVLADSFQGRTYVGPQSVLDYLQRKIGAPGAQKQKAGASTASVKKKTTTAHLSANTLKVGAIGVKKGTPIAIINGKIYKKGDTIADGVTVTKIEHSYVELSLYGKMIQLKP